MKDLLMNLAGRRARWGVGAGLVVAFCVITLAPR